MCLSIGPCACACFRLCLLDCKSSNHPHNKRGGEERVEQDDKKAREGQHGVWSAGVLIFNLYLIIQKYYFEV